MLNHKTCIELTLHRSIGGFEDKLVSVFIVLLMSWLCFCSGSAGYCFVELADESSVERCVQRLNGKLVPGSNPVSSLMWLLHICSISSTQSLQRSKIVVIHLNFKIYLLLPVLPFDFFGAPVMLSLVVVKLKRTAAIRHVWTKPFTKKPLKSPVGRHNTLFLFAGSFESD